MKNSTICLLCLLFVFSGCKKDNIVPTPLSNLSFLDSSVQFLKSQLSKDDFTKLDLTINKILRYHNESIGIQIFEKNCSPKKFLILGKESNGYTGNWVDMTGIIISANKKYQSGTILLESLDKSNQTKLTVQDNKVIEIYKSNLKNSISQKIVPSNKESSTSKQLDEAVLSEIVVYFTPEIDYFSLYWMLNGDGSYGGYYYSDESGGGDGGGGSDAAQNKDNVVAAPTFISPKHPIADIKAELKCFTQNPSSSYSISININQPNPGTRDVFTTNSDFHAGHIYLTFEQDNSDGSATIRNVGFYPQNFVMPGNSVSASTFGEDSNTPYDISLKIHVSGSDLNTVINSLVSQQSHNYDLSNFNCANSSVQALNSIGIHLPETKSNSILFGGENPGDLGEDVRNLNLNNFSSNNGSRKIERTVSNSDDQMPPSKKGTC